MDHNASEGNGSLVPDPPAFTDDEIRHCRETGDFRPILFEWYKFVGCLAILLAHIQRESSAFRPITAAHYYVLIGLLHRCARLMLSNVALSHEGRFGETTAIVDRCIFESAVKILWLLREPTDERFNRYLADGLKKDIEFKRRIEAEICARAGTPLSIETRMLQSIRNNIAAAGMTEEKVTVTKKLPDIASMIDGLGVDRLFYVIGQQMGSHHIHGTWSSLLIHYLEKQNIEGQFQFGPKGHCDTDLAQYVFVALIVIEAMNAYVEYMFEDSGDTAAFVKVFESAEAEIHKIYLEDSKEDFVYTEAAKSSPL
jgi:hypothetical protein